MPNSEFLQKQKNKNIKYKMKNSKTTKNTYTLSIVIMTLTLVFTYIICIYKTVVLASAIEVNNKKIEILSTDINQKEFDYIRDISLINLDKAISLGYKKNSEDIIAYVNINDNSEFALR